VLGVRIRVQEADRQRLHPLVDELAGRLADDRPVERPQDPPLRIDALRHLANVLELDERLRLEVREEAEERARRPGLGEMQQMRPAARDQEADACASPLEDGVRRHGRPVEDRLQLVRRRPSLFADRANAGEHADRLIGSRGRRLRDPEVVRRGIVQEDVRERPADVHAEPELPFCIQGARILV
jgi:hypothetical protein